MEFVKNYTIPDDLAADGFSQEQIDNCCYPPGEYEIWDKGGLVGDSTTGGQLWWVEGTSTDDKLHYTKGEHAACLYGEYYWRSTYDYDFTLYLWVNGVEQIISQGTATPSHNVDDFGVPLFEVWDYYGKPVFIFSYYQHFFDQDNYVRFGLYFEDELELSDKHFESADWSQKYLVYNALADFGACSPWHAECIPLVLSTKKTDPD